LFPASNEKEFGALASHQRPGELFKISAILKKMDLKALFKALAKGI